MDSRWRLVLVSGVCLGFSFYPVTGATFGLFVTPIITETGWSRGQTALAYSLTMGLAGVTAPLCGLIMDRWGARRVLLVCTTLSALLLASGSLLGQSLALFYLIYLALGLIGIGHSPVAYSWIIVRWFDRNRGLALGLAAMGLGIGMMILPQLVEPVIRIFGWRSGYFVLAGSIVLVVIPLVHFCITDYPPGVPHRGTPGTDETPAPGRSFMEAFKTRTFWLLLVCFSVLATLVYGVMLHLPPMLADRGVASEHAALALSTAGVGVILGRVLAGVLLDHLEPRLVVMGFFGMTMLGAVLLLGSELSVARGLTAACLVGMGLGAEGDFLAYLASRYFGLRAFGTIYGAIGIAVPFGGFLGPVLMGYAHDLWGGYQPMLLTLLGACLLAAVGVFGFRTELAETAGA